MATLRSSLLLRLRQLLSGKAAMGSALRFGDSESTLKVDANGSMKESNLDKKFFNKIAQDRWIADSVEFNSEVPPRNLKISSSFVVNSTSIQEIFWRVNKHEFTAMVY